MQNTKTVILTAVLTTLATNLFLSLFSSWLFWLALFLAVWLYLGYLGNVMDGEKGLDPLAIFGPVCFGVCLMMNKTDGLKRLWKHFFSKPLPKIRSPFVFDKSDE